MPHDPSFVNLYSVPGSGPGDGELEGSGVAAEGDYTKTNFMLGLFVPETPLTTFLGTHVYFRDDLPDITGFWPRRVFVTLLPCFVSWSTSTIIFSNTETDR